MSLPNPKSIAKKNPKQAIADGVTRLGIVKKPAAAPAAMPEEQAPTIDTAEQQARNNIERLRRRRGVLANIYGGKATLG